MACVHLCYLYIVLYLLSRLRRLGDITVWAISSVDRRRYGSRGIAIWNWLQANIFAFVHTENSFVIVTKDLVSLYITHNYCSLVKLAKL